MKIQRLKSGTSRFSVHSGKLNYISCSATPYRCSRGISLLFSPPTKTPDGLLCQRQPNLQADLLHTRLMVSRSSSPPVRPHQSPPPASTPPPPLTPPHWGFLPCGATLLMDSIRHQNNKAVHRRRTVWSWWCWWWVQSLPPSHTPFCPTLESRGEATSPPTDVYCHTRQASRPKQPPPNPF